MNSITVYGTDWCGDTIRTIQHLDGLGVPYDYVDIEQDPSLKTGSSERMAASSALRQ
jgi:glutaredoxin-related protein